MKPEETEAAMSSTGLLLRRVLLQPSRGLLLARTRPSSSSGPATKAKEASDTNAKSQEDLTAVDDSIQVGVVSYC